MSKEKDGGHSEKKLKIPREVEVDRKIELDINNWIWFYYDQGFSIIPLKEKEKRPNITSWKKYIQERPTKEEIQGWIDKKLFKNIGVVCGAVSDNLVVIDIDDKKIIEILNLMETRQTSTEDDITTIKKAIKRIEIRMTGKS